MTGARGRGVTRTRLAAALAAIVSVPISAVQSPGGPGLNRDYATIAEGYTAAVGGGPIEGAYRMFSAPDLAGICAQARAAAVTSLRAAPQLHGHVGEPIPYAKFKVDALDAHRVLVPRVPIAIESQMWSEVLDTRQDHIGGTSVTPNAVGTIRVRIRTICGARGGEALITVSVDR